MLSLALLQAALAATSPAGEVDRVCKSEYCEVLVIQLGHVVLATSTRTVEIGIYVPDQQHLVPPTEAPIRTIVSKHGWRAVISAFLNHEELEAGLRVRFFAPGGGARGTAEIYMSLVDAQIGQLFGGSDEVFVATSTEEHSYNSRIGIWLLPERGRPKLLAKINGSLSKFVQGDSRTQPGVWIKRQTYDGVRADTKGWVDEFLEFDPEQRSLATRK